MANNTEAAAFGQGSAASGTSSTALGTDSIALLANSTAVGDSAAATFANSTAVGQGSTASAANASAFGQGATAAFANSTAIGQGATTTAANQVVIGTATTTFSAPGITSAASTAAQVGATQFVTTDANGNLASVSMSGVLQPAFEGIATAIALGAGPAVLPDGKDFAASLGYGNYAGQNAVSISGAARVNENIFVNAGVATSTNSGEVGVRAAATYAW